MKKSVPLAAVLIVGIALSFASCAETLSPSENVIPKTTSIESVNSFGSITTISSRSESNSNISISSVPPYSSDTKPHVSSACDYTNLKWTFHFAGKAFETRVGEILPIDGILSPIYPTDGYITFSYKISDTSIADFRSSTRTPIHTELKGLHPGTCTFTITGKTSTGETISDTCTITVTE